MSYIPPTNQQIDHHQSLQMLQQVSVLFHDWIKQRNMYIVTF